VAYGLATSADEALAHIAGGASPLDDDTWFEIGSVTEVFTAILLADMFGQGEVWLNDPISAWMPEAALPHRGRTRGRSRCLTWPPITPAWLASRATSCRAP
jgi:CubicO group peptidase (beta-lactamase class C family)